MIFDLLTPPQGPRGRAQKHQDKPPQNLAEVNKIVAIFPVNTLLHYFQYTECFKLQCKTVVT